MIGTSVCSLEKITMDNGRQTKNGTAKLQANEIANTNTSDQIRPRQKDAILRTRRELTRGDGVRKVPTDYKNLKKNLFDGLRGERLMEALANEVAVKNGIPLKGLGQVIAMFKRVKETKDA